jgi:hypothetical protein
MNMARFAALAGAAAAVSGCAHLPGLSFEADRPSELTIGDIRSHIYCELQHAGVPADEYVTVLLTLQVEDSVDI